MPVYAVLGNHDHHANRVDELTAILEAAGVVVLERSWATRRSIADTTLGIAGTKGFVGGFPGARCPTSASRSCARCTRRRARTSPRSTARSAEIADCPLRVVAAPLLADDEHARRRAGVDLDVPRHRTASTGRSRSIDPDLVLHGHAHEGTFAGAVGPVPVYNVAVHVMRRDFFVFELDTDAPDGHGARLEATV